MRKGKSVIQYKGHRQQRYISLANDLYFQQPFDLTEMFKKVFVALVFAVTAVRAENWVGPLRIMRDMAPDWQPDKQDVRDFGCIVVRRDDKNPPWAAVAQTSGDECAQFEKIHEGNHETPEWRFKELSTGMLMNHAGDWIYFSAGPNDKSASTLMIIEQDAHWNTRISYPVLRPSDSSNFIYAQYDSGDMNVKNSGFKAYIVIR
ncbi:hypothetical protein B0H34DRAFT_518855 [Crassisporium funariophilum]|nr:hypothetical protein B0H34DRAFT_518855 [Crassisporium funariophilum]